MVRLGQGSGFSWLTRLSANAHSTAARRERVRPRVCVPPGLCVSESPENQTLTGEAPAPVSCDDCGRIIGVYEPLVMFDEGHAWETSRARTYGLPLTARYYHRDCYRTL